MPSIGDLQSIALYGDRAIWQIFIKINVISTVTIIIMDLFEIPYMLDFQQLLGVLSEFCLILWLYLYPTLYQCIPIAMV